MVCGCCNHSSEVNDDARDDDTQPQNRSSPKAPSQINMSRGAPIPVSDEDIQAVKAWRDSRKATPQKERKEHFTQEWQESGLPLQRTTRLGAPEKSKMATLESIEVDDLSTVSPSLKYAGDNRPTAPNNLPLPRPNSDWKIQRSVAASPVPSAVRPIRSQGSDDQGLRTIEGAVSGELDSVLEPGGVEKLNSSPSLINGGQRIWSPTAVPLSLSSDGRDSQRIRSAPTSSLEDSNRRGQQSPVPDSNTLQVREQSDPDLNGSFSDLPSDVDTEVREQYLLACRLLKTTMMKKEKTLNEVENEFLRKLVQDTPSVPSQSQIAAVKQASETLMSDPLFRVPSPRESSQATTESEGKIVQRKKKVAAYALDEAKQYPFRVLGNTEVKFQVLTPMVMEALRGFLPMSIAEENFWLKFSFDRDGGTLMTLLSKVRTSMHTILAVETTSGFVFGVFCSAPWRVQRSWFGSGECFVWRLKHSRRRSNRESRSHLNDNEMEVYPYTGHDDLVQFVTNKTLAVGGGDWERTESNPFPREPTGIGFTIDGDLLGGETNSCATFASPRLCGRLTNNTEFEIESIEVWTLTPSNTVEQAEILETRKFFVESNRKQA